MTNSENRVVLGGRRAGKTERLRKWQEEHSEVLGVLTGQVPIQINECDHENRCCREHKTHSNPHRGCILR